MKSVLVFTVHKAASMFLHKLVTDIGKRLKLDAYSINNKKYYDQIKNTSWKSFIESKTGPSCFGPIRAGEDVALPVFPDCIEKYRVILHIRDPRDVLTSAYYSHVYSHKITDRFKPSSEQRQQWEEEGVDNFVLNRIGRVKKEYEELCTKLLGRDNLVLVKYEDMVTNYEKWLKEFMSAFSEFEPRQKVGLSLILGKSTHEKINAALYDNYKDDFLPAKNNEDVRSHKRQITPGDYARKLEKATIETLNGEFAAILTSFGY